MSDSPCKLCDLITPHYHTEIQAPNGDWVECTIYTGRDPRAEVRDPDTGEVIFPAVKGPLRVVRS